VIRKRLFLRVVLAASAAILIRLFVFQPFIVTGNSMEPTLKDRRICFVYKLAYRLHKPRRGDIVVFRTTQDPPLYFVKRIIGLPDEKIRIENGIIFVNGKPVNEPYAIKNRKWNMSPVTVKEKCVYVVGDSDKNDLNDQFHGQIALKNLMGLVVLFE
jgi:signal peptidase I